MKNLFIKKQTLDAPRAIVLSAVVCAGVIAFNVFTLNDIYDFQQKYIEFCTVHKFAMDMVFGSCAGYVAMHFIEKHW